MIGYIYHITNELDGKKYIGKTWNINQRLSGHFSDLKKKKHHSHKLQRAVNKYGIEHFKVTYEEREVESEEALALAEIAEIEKYDSYNNGYNETLGGEGHKVALDFNTSVLVYQILKRYEGVGRQIARYYDCDHSVIGDIKKNDLYANVVFNEEDVQFLIRDMGLSEENLICNYKPHNDRKLDESRCLELLAVVRQTTGYEKTMCEIFSINSKLIYNLKKGIIYKDYIAKYDSLTAEEQKQLLENTLTKYKVKDTAAKRQRKCVKDPLTQEQVNYILDNKDKMTRVQIGLDLGISADRVGNVILGRSYKDLVQHYYSSLT